MTNEKKEKETGHGELVAKHLDTIVKAIDSIARRRALSLDDRDELLSFAMEKLVERERKVFARFGRLASWRTYLERVVERLWIDLTYARWGRWRPTAKARRLGTTAVELDRLVRREALDPRMAAAMVGARRPHRHTLTLADLARELAVCRRPVSIPLDGVEPAEPPNCVSARREKERRSLAEKLLVATREALGDLPPDERKLMRLRFLEGRSGPEIACETGLGQAEVYRRIYTVLSRLARNLKERGFDSWTVRTVTDSDASVVISRGELDAALASE